jgi:hypothetical protein
VKIAIQITAPVRRLDRCCTPDSRSRRSKPRCQHTTTIAFGDAQPHAALNQVAFSGRIRHKALKPGRYLARLAATDDAGASRAETLRFTIVKHDGLVPQSANDPVSGALHSDHQRTPTACVAPHLPALLARTPLGTR